MKISQIWNDVPCGQLPWYHRAWVELLLGVFYIGCALVGGAIAMAVLVTVPIWFLPYVYFSK